MLTEQINWIPVTERLPDEDETVLIYAPTSDEPIWLGFMSGASGRWYDVDGYHLTPRAVTHWAAIPKGPTT